jgi:hypothetical protein
MYPPHNWYTVVYAFLVFLRRMELAGVKSTLDAQVEVLERSAVERGGVGGPLLKRGGSVR